MEYEKLCEIDRDIEQTNEYLYGIMGILRNMEKVPFTPEYVKLIPADSVPVFVFSADMLDADMERVRHELKHFFGDRKVLAIRGGDVDILAIVDQGTSK